MGMDPSEGQFTRPGHHQPGASGGAAFGQSHTATVPRGVGILMAFFLVGDLQPQSLT